MKKAIELYDDEGYPTEEALDYLRFFHGSPCEMVDYSKSLYNGGWVNIEEDVDQWDRKFHKVTFVTGGWSGAESVSDVLHDTLFHFAFWEMSRRGGLVEYRVFDRVWNETGDWGLIGERKTRNAG